MPFFFSWDTRCNHTFMPYIMNVVTKQEKGSLDISFDLISFWFLLNKPHSRHHIYWMYLYFSHSSDGDHVMTLIKRHSQWLFHFSKGFCLCVYACVTYWKMKGKCQVEWKEKESQNELLLVLWCCLFIQSFSFELLKELVYAWKMWEIF